MPTDSVVHQLAIRAGNKLRVEHLTLATAESCTGGMIATAITDISGSSQWFERGFVTYSNQAKIEMIGVPADLIDKHGAVSEP
ncbi:nicotinamide-nucleotide amidohydrolase family protein, partial [Staphylococcus capitis]|nr:nicotinamide-nucleotide amidohydrolase family protein [Staphylococcus capitis]